jgi:hypothetical protein
MDNLAFDKPARYRIRVQGRIKESWSDRLEGMAIIRDSPDEKPTFTLEGELKDQAALIGVLNTLYALHQTVLLVRCLKDPPTTD